MPRKSVPAYCHHKASGQGYVKIDGRRIYLGTYGTPESHQKYAAEIAKWQTVQENPPSELTVGQLTLLYFEFAQKHYVKDGKPTSKIHVIQMAIRALNRECRNSPATELTPRKFKAVRERLIEAGSYCRTTINDLMGIIRRIVKWAVSEELLKPEQLVGLGTVRDLQKGRCDAPESKPVQPVELADVDAVKPYIAEPLWGAIQFQLATAARPSEALNLRLGDIDRSGDVWLFKPGSHKTQHHDKTRLILIGPKGQAVILSHAESTDPKAFVFAVPSSDGKKAYRRDSYGLAIRRACKRANVEHWAPNQLRHRAASDIRKAAGSIETVREILGHSELRTSEIYSERSLVEASEIVKKIG